MEKNIKMKDIKELGEICDHIIFNSFACKECAGRKKSR